MSLFGKLTSEGLEQSQDRIGGGFQPLDSGVYTATIKALYAGQSAGGAMSLTLLAELPGGKEYRETVYVTNKAGQNFFLNKEDRTKKVPLPGFTVGDDLCLIATGKPLAEQDAEDKVINVYDFEAKKEMPKSVPMIVEAIGQQVSLGIIKQIVNKNVKQGTEYVATAETREENFIDKVFHPTLKVTVAEARNDQDEPKFQEAWIARNKDQVRDRRTIKDGEAGTASNGRPPKAGAAPAAGAQTARKSLFGG
jgi:hypothetical protein